MEVTFFWFREILQHKIEKFNATFQRNCQEQSSPPSLQSFMGTVKSGSGSFDNEHYKQALLSVSQLLEFDTIICSRKTSASIYHSVNREPPLPVYLATIIYNKTRHLSIIEKLSQLGLCFSKHRLSDISISMGNSVIKNNQADRVAIPTSLQLFFL